MTELSTGFWFAALALGLAALYCASTESLLFMSIITIIAAVGLSYTFPLAVFILNNPLILIAGVLVYVVIGTGWAFFKWYLYIRERISLRNAKIEERVQELKDKKEPDLVRTTIKDFINNGFDKKPDDYLGEIVEPYWSKVRRHEGIEYVKDIPYQFKQPLIADNKERFTTWLIFWPFSVAVFCLYDSAKAAWRLVQRTATSIYHYCAKRLQAVSDKLWRD
jgi:hypothetical protein